MHTYNGQLSLFINKIQICLLQGRRSESVYFSSYYRKYGARNNEHLSKSLRPGTRPSNVVVVKLAKNKNDKYIETKTSFLKKNPFDEKQNMMKKLERTCNKTTFLTRIMKHIFDKKELWENSFYKKKLCDKKYEEKNCGEK